MSETILDKIPRITPVRAHAWLIERLENACVISAKKTGKDRDAWLEDAAHFCVAANMLHEAIEAGHQFNSSGERGPIGAMVAPVECEATPQQRLDFLANECRRTLAVLDRLNLARYFDAVGGNDPHAQAIATMQELLRPALHVLGYDTTKPLTRKHHREQAR